MLLASLPIGRQRRYDLLLAFVPIALFGALVASWALPVPFHVGTLIGATVVGVVLFTYVVSRPPGEH